MAGLIAQVDPWRFQFHPEVWLLIGAIVGLGVYAVRVIGPIAVRDGSPIVTRRQKISFVAGVLVLWLAADWPMHDIAEEYLYFVHMVQHLLISFFVPPLLLLATPRWLARLLIVDGTRTDRVVRLLTKPLVAGLAFNIVQILSHWAVVVNFSVENGPFHYFLHILVFVSSLMMWTPVIGPLSELRLADPARMLYLFLMSLVPTVPAGWLTFAEGALYSSYDKPFRMWGISVTSDQQAAGVVMKIIGGFFLWAVIAILFARYASRQRKVDEESRRARRAEAKKTLTFDEVEARFAEAGDPAREPAVETNPPDSR